MHPFYGHCYLSAQRTSTKRLEMGLASQQADPSYRGIYIMDVNVPLAPPNYRLKRACKPPCPRFALPS